MNLEAGDLATTMSCLALLHYLTVLVITTMVVAERLAQKRVVKFPRRRLDLRDELVVNNVVKVTEDSRVRKGEDHGRRHLDA